MTLRELSKLCNVSISTVSKAFSSADDISQETKERIFEVAKKYGCYGKFYKGKYEKKVIAVICPELSNYYIGYVEYIKNLIEKSGGVCIVSTDDFIEEKQQELLDLTANLSSKAKIAVISGSVPKGVDYDYYGKLASTIPNDVKVIIDA